MASRAVGPPRPRRAGDGPPLRRTGPDRVPGQLVAVDDARTTERFFASSWAQYDGVEDVDGKVEVFDEAPGTLWVDVTWSYGGQAREKFRYQLVATPGGHRIAVLTPLELEPA